MRPVSQELYPFRPNWLEVDGGHQLHYLDEGSPDAPAVLMLHGNPTWSFYWRRLIVALRATHRVIVPDHIGCGKSAMPPDEEYAYTLERRIADIDHLAEHLALSEVTLMVHDWGGMIGFGWADRHPELVSQLVLLNTAAFPLPATKPLPRSLWWARNTALGAGLVRGLNAFSRGAARWCVTRRRLEPAVRKGLLAPYDSWDSRRAVLRFVQDIPLAPEDPGYDVVAGVGDRLDRFAYLPALICWGDRDFVFDEHFLEVWRQKLPRAKVHQFPDCGHYVLEDAPEEIEGLVLDFLGVAR